MSKKKTTPTKKRTSFYERFMAMTPEQRDAEVAVFDKEDLLSGKPLTAADRALHRRAAPQAARKAKIGRPTIGKGAKIVPVTIERGLLEEADAYARRHGLKRSQMVAQGLRLVMREKRKSA